MRSKSRITKQALSASALVAAVAAIGTAGVASGGDSRAEQYRAQLDSVPHSHSADGGSDADGNATIVRKDDKIKVLLKANGVSPNLPHAVHIHGHEAAGEIASCPGADRRDDLVDDGLIETVEGIDDYGPVLVSFTTSGDTSPASVLALDRFPVARDNGTFTYNRNIDVPAETVADRLDELHIVVHGHDINGDGQYGGRTTALGAPLEGELPVACGKIGKR